MEKIMVVGGYGDVGKAAVTELLRASSNQIVIGGRSKQKGEQLLKELKEANLSFQRIDIYEEATYQHQLQEITTVIMCLSPKTIDFAAYCLQSGINYLDISASNQTTAELFDLDSSQIKAVGLLGIGICPGLSTLLVKQLAVAFDQIDQIELSLLLGMGDHFGDDALNWLLTNLSQPFRWYNKGNWVKVKSFQGKKKVPSGPDGKSFTAYTFNLADQQIISQDFKNSEVATYFAIDEKKLLFLLMLLTKINFFKLLKYPKIYQLVLRFAALSQQTTSQSTDLFSIHVKLKGTKAGKASIREETILGKNSSEMTGKIAAHSALLLQEKQISNQLCYLNAAFELSDFHSIMQFKTI